MGSIEEAMTRPSKFPCRAVSIVCAIRVQRLSFRKWVPRLEGLSAAKSSGESGGMEFE